MSKIILTEIELNRTNFKDNLIKIVKINSKTIKKFADNKNVFAIIGSRATANVAIDLDFPNLKLYQLTSAGFDGIDLEKFSAKNVAICNAGDVYSVPIAETVIYGMLKFEKRFHNNPKRNCLRLTRKYKYIGELKDKNLLIMGCGGIGNAVCKRANGFEMNVYGYNRGNKKVDGYIEIFNSKELLKQNLNKFDYIVTTIPLTDQTKGFINNEILNCCNKNAVFINVARQGIFDKKDFISFLKRKQIKGAVLDMFEKIPNPITNPYRRLKNVIVMPGVSAISTNVKERLEKVVTENCQLILTKQPPKYKIN